MEHLNINEVTEVIGGTLIKCTSNIIIRGVSITVKNVKPGDLFIPMTRDLHKIKGLVKEATENGAIAVVLPHRIKFKIPQIIVKSNVRALKILAKYYRSKFEMPIIGVTGSYGKTSTRGMIASVLNEKFNIHKTEQDVNGPVGVPLTLLNLDKTHQISVLEIGFPGRSGHFGVIRRVSNIVRPFIGVITNVGTAHLETLKNKNNVFKAKMEITSNFKKDNILIVNGDDPYLSKIKKRAYKVIKVSLEGKGDYNAFDVVNLGEEGVEFKCMLKGKEQLFKVNVPGVHNVRNALMAIAIGEVFNMDIEQIKKGVSNYKTEGFRMKIINLKNGVKIIEDCFNASVDSMKSSVHVLENFKDRRRIAILGDMLELGDYSEEAHSEVGRYLSGRCDMLIAVGTESKYIYEQAKDNLDSKYFDNKKDACRFIKSIIKKNDVILIKGSRALKMEKVTEYLTLKIGKL
jgi:UDP-N-acetylmuramoyl-tripeptide--D-alanyl-D-alanine ligase